MKTLIYSTIIGISTMLFSCEMIDDSWDSVIPEKNVTVQHKEMHDFQELNVESAFTVYVNFSETEESVRVEANENLHQYIEVFKDGDELTIRVKRHISIKRQPTLKAYITTSNIHSYRVSGASRVILQDQLQTGSVSISLSGASHFKGDIKGDELYGYISGASQLQISGKCATFDAELTGASNMAGSGFECDEANVTLSGASMAELKVNNQVDVSASGASVFKYWGLGSIHHQSLSGGSKIIKM